ncbi:MAG TPA: hypothetical protein VHW66_05500 [Stellaceae bacterium]|nr:hypothetical protein [Stellaceae bacterium]
MDEELDDDRDLESQDDAQHPFNQDVVSLQRRHVALQFRNIPLELGNIRLDS